MARAPVAETKPAPERMERMTHLQWLWKEVVAEGDKLVETVEVQVQPPGVTISGMRQTSLYAAFLRYLEAASRER